MTSQPAHKQRLLRRVRRAVVRLTGLVKSEGMRETAEADAWYVFGVDDVINEIEVRA